MVAASKDVAVLRELAKKYVAVCNKPVQSERRDLWRRHNSLVKTRPLVFVRGGDFWEEVPQVAALSCQEDFFRPSERFLRRMLFQDTIGDDCVFEPWITVRARHKCSGWGVELNRRHSGEARGSWKMDYPIKDLADVRKLRPARHEIDEEATARAVERVQDAIGDILAVNVDRGPAYRTFGGGDISTDLGYLRGIENFMLDMMDNPKWLHGLLGFLRDGVLAAHDQAEAAGDWGLSNSDNQAVPYARRLPDPAANARGVRREKLWVFLAAQEYELVSPQMHEEFMLAYQRPIIEKFGLASYGCCENLTNKIDMLRSVRNLRRIAVAPRADVWRCAEQIGADYVISWRPNPAEMVCCGFDADHIRKVVKDAMEACKGLHVDITLKDVHTVQNQPQRLREWVKVVREIADDYA